MEFLFLCSPQHSGQTRGLLSGPSVGLLATSISDYPRLQLQKPRESNHPDWASHELLRGKYKQLSQTAKLQEYFFSQPRPGHPPGPFVWLSALAHSKN